MLAGRPGEGGDGSVQGSGLSLCPLDPLPQPGSQSSTAAGRHNQQEEEEVRRWTKTQCDLYCKLKALCSLNSSTSTTRNGGL